MSQNYNHVTFNIQPGFNEATKLHHEDYYNEFWLHLNHSFTFLTDWKIACTTIYLCLKKRLPVPQRINSAVNYQDWVGRGGGEVISLMIGWEDQMQSAWWYKWWLGYFEPKISCNIQIIIFIAGIAKGNILVIFKMII